MISKTPIQDINHRSTLAIITARGGSKGLPRKNILYLGNKPLIAWTIDSANKCQEIDRVIVSTDDEEIAAVSVKWGADVPFVRPSELASDDARSEAVVFHALEWLAQNEAYFPETVCLLQPTSPLRTSVDIKNALTIMNDKNADAVVSVTLNMRPVEWFRRLGPEGELVPYQEGTNLQHRQNAESLYQLNGAIYLIKTEVLYQCKSFYPDHTFSYIMPSERSIDIDNRLDLIIAEAILKQKPLYE